MKILGISPFHDSSVCLVEDGLVKTFYKEERFSRVKRDNHPVISLEKIKNNYKEIDYSVICSPSNGDSSLSVYKSYIKKNFLGSEIIDISDQHHLQHASLAFYNSGFEKALVFVIDRNGSFVGSNCRESESVFYAEYPNTFTELYKSYWKNSSYPEDKALLDINNFYKNKNKNVDVEFRGNHGIVRAYESATTLIQENVLENGKTMGLSSYGEYRKEFDNLFLQNEKTNDNILGVENYENNFEVSINKKYYKYAKNNFTYKDKNLYADYAYAVQKQTQEAVLRLIEKYVKKTGIKNVCVTGGFGLNVVANSYYVKMIPEINFYFEPLADDSGNSIGGAMLIYRHFSKDKKINFIKDTFYHGDLYNLNSIEGENCSAKETAKLISEKNSIAIFEGNAEAGPRALGHRSILFDAREKNAKDIVNKIKKREWYRPFAAIVLEEDAYLYFNMICKKSEYMTMSFECTDYAKQNVPGIIHVDNTCRIQTVNKNNKTLYNLLLETKKITNYGVLLNTSFNLAGEPLVETPQEAIDVLHRSELDFLWFPEIGKILK
jgi:carbamoyltransferase